jgi:antitoxin component YwqK of YwqJK toxin-antitoxin module
MINYNKNYQNKLGIDIECYKKQSGRYKIGEKDGLGKLFILNTEILLYEGRYKNGIKNGKGKEYNEKGNLIFKGIFLEGKNGMDI